MDKKEAQKAAQSSDNQAAEKFPGASVDIADDEKVTKRMVAQRVKIQNNNPRNND